MLRNYLIGHNVYVATYWDEFTDHINLRLKNLTDSIVALPVDQHWGSREMNHIINLIQHFQV